MKEIPIKLKTQLFKFLRIKNQVLKQTLLSTTT
jgi:hypothetical protein